MVQIKEDAVNFKDRILSQQQFEGLTLNNPSLANPAALASDVQQVTGGNNLVASIGEIEAYSAAENPVFVSANSVTIDKTTIMEKKCVKGGAIRFSSDGVSWKYGLIIDVTINAGTIDLVIEGVEMTAPTVAFVEVGSTDIVNAVRIFIPGALISGDDQISSVLKQEMTWNFAKGFIVSVEARVNTPSSSGDVLVNVAVGNAANNVTLSDINLGEASDRVFSDTDINEANYEIDFRDKIFINIDNIGTGSEDLEVVLIIARDALRQAVYTPVGSLIPPFAYRMTGSNNPSSVNSGHVNSVDIFSLDGTGGAQARGNDLLGRVGSCATFDATRTFNVGGQGSSTAHDDITFFETQSTVGAPQARGIVASLIRFAMGLSGLVYGYICGGASSISVSARNDMFRMLLPSASGDATLESVLPYNVLRAAPAMDNQKGVLMGGCNSVTASTEMDDICEQSIDVGNPTAVSRGVVSYGIVQMGAGLSNRIGNEAYIAGGSQTGISSGSYDAIHAINLLDGSGDTVSRGVMSVGKIGALGNGGTTKSCFSGGTRNGSVLSGDMEEFSFGETITVDSRGSLVQPTHNAGGGF